MSGRPLAELAGVEVAVDGVVALHAIDIHVGAGEVLAVHGPSGSGKTTLLGVLAGWLEPTAGTLRLAPPLDGPDRGRWHRTATVPQLLGLLPELSLLENVAVAHRLGGTPWSESAALAAARLDQLGIADLGDRRPSEVSLGQQQRAAVARALTARPTLLLADEPTAHLDAATADLVLDALLAAASAGTAVVVASHDPAVLARADRSIPVGEPAQDPSAARI
jgi:putative ABC transport system ATP-binding protein